MKGIRARAGLALAAAMLTVTTAAASAPAWHIVPSPNGDLFNSLGDVTCVTHADCWAVGNLAGGGRAG